MGPSWHWLKAASKSCPGSQKTAPETTGAGYTFPALGSGRWLASGMVVGSGCDGGAGWARGGCWRCGAAADCCAVCWLGTTLGVLRVGLRCCGARAFVLVVREGQLVSLLCIIHPAEPSCAIWVTR